MIKIQDLIVSFGGRPVLNCPLVQFEPGQVHGIIGLNGAGKTTFFNSLSRFLKPDSGQILFQGQPVRRSDIGYLETSNFFYSGIKGQEYLDIFPATNQQFNLRKLNDLLQIPLHQLIEDYSTGMRKKLALLAVLKQDKPIYIFDEPFNGLDLESNKVLELIIGNLKEKGKTIFISSHILSPLFHVCDSIHLLRQGEFTQHYTSSQFAGIDQELYTSFNQRATEILTDSL